MLSRFLKVTRAVWLAIALLALSGAPLWAQASACPPTSTGGQTGKSYRLVSQSLVTETRTVQLSTGGPCLLGGSATSTTSEQYNVGYYEDDDGNTARVDCRNGRITGWV